MIARADDSDSSDLPGADALQHCTGWSERTLTPVPEPSAVNDVPAQPVPHHDNDSDGAAPFIRPPSPEIDFARVVRRADLCRTASRTAQVSTGATGLLLIAFLLTSSRVLMVLTLLAAAVLTCAIAVRLRLAAAPIPYLSE